LSAGPAASEVPVAFSLGSNLGIREENIVAAFSCLARIEGLTGGAASSLYETSPVGIVTKRNFINAAWVGRTRIPPHDLLALCKGIERKFGRDPDALSADRTLDIDIIAYGDAVIGGGNLTIPHPRFRERLFVLLPLVEICPGLKVPPSGIPIVRLLRGCAGPGWVRKVSARGDTLNFLKTKKLE
jgi:2-amino-4-hydroxy-6-hydroxymethyldihydropteridine diphosphokinase